MAYTALTTQEVATGEPTKTELFTKVKSNFSDHEVRISDLEATLSGLDPIVFGLIGRYSDFGAQDNVLFYPVRFDMTLLAARLLILGAGVSGTTEIDVMFKRGAGSWTTIFTTRPSVAYSAGDLALSSNAVLGVTSLLAGDLLRVDIKAVQALAKDAIVYLERERTS